MADERVNADFDRARQKAFIHDILAAIRRQPNELIPYHEIRQRLTPEGESYRGMQVVSVNQIVGSLDRFQDFNRAFLPRQKHTASRWKRIDEAFYQDVRLPPIQLYKVGDVYFVKDGNHRVSVAREKGVDYIDAEVIEVHIRVPLTASMSIQELLLQVEYAEFLRRTDLDKLRPEHDIRPTALGRYDEIWQHIQAHQQWLGALWHRPATIHEAVTDWYDYVYQPIVKVVAEQGVLDRLPERTEADVYLWVMRHRHQLEQRYGQDFGPVASARDYAEELAEQPGPLRRALRGLVERVLPERSAPPEHRPRVTPDPFPKEQQEQSPDGTIATEGGAAEPGRSSEPPVAAEPQPVS